METVEKATAIRNARIQFVSLVDKAANLRTFLLKKEKGGKATFSTFGRIVKTDSENHYVTGVVYEPMTEDSQGDYMEEAEIVKAAYYFAKNGNKIDIQHSFEPFGGATVVENWVAKADFKIGDEEIRKGTWLLTVEVTDTDVWDKIEKGEITGFSMGGVGEYSEEDVNLDSVGKQETSERKGLLKQLAKALGLTVVEKGAMAELYEERSKSTRFWEAFRALQDCLGHFDYCSDKRVYETNGDKIRECLEDFGQIITDLLTTEGNITKSVMEARPVEKAGKKMSGKNRETLKGIYESLGAFLKEFDDPELEEDEEGKKKATPEAGGDGTEDTKGAETKQQEPEDGTDKTKKEDKEVTKQEVEQIMESAITKALGVAKGQAATTPETPAPVEKAAEITPDAIEQMVSKAIEKAMQPQQEAITAEQVGSMIEAAVAKAMEPVLKAKGLPSNLGSATVEKGAGEEPHYLHGIL